MTVQVANGDCLELMKSLPDKSVDLFICDLPYGETNCSWDSVIDLAEFWKQFKRVRKSKRTACIHFCSTKFGFSLIKSWEKGFKMDMVWKKRNKTGGLAAKYRPMRNHEMVYFFYEQAPLYNRDKYHTRVMPKNEYTHAQSGVYNEVTAGGAHSQSTWSPKFSPPHPASVLEEVTAGGTGVMSGPGREYGQKFSPPHPASVLEENVVLEEGETTVYGMPQCSLDPTKGGRINPDGSYTTNYDPLLPASVYESTKVFIGKRHHQTEKPQDILEFFLKYWSDEGHTILDPTMGSGSTGVACQKLGRNFIGYEMNPTIFAKACERLEVEP